MTAPKPKPAPMAGMRPWELNAIHPDPMRTGDRPIERPERPCSRCRKMFQPTLKRRMLCAGCFNGDRGGLDAA